MTTFLGPDEATNVDLAESRHKRNQAHVACFLHLRDLVYLHPKAASASAVSFVQTLEAKVIAERAAREKRLAEVCAREASRRYEADRQKAAAEQAKAAQEKTERATADNGDG
jgi:hypothetical protein